MILFAINPVYAEYISCQDLDKKILKKVLFEKIEFDLKKLNALFPTIVDLDKYKSSTNDDLIIREKWEEFKNRSQIKFVEDPIEVKYKDPKICGFDIILKLATTDVRFNDIELKPTVIITKKFKITDSIGFVDSLKIENKWWLSENAAHFDGKQSRLLGRVADSFHSFMLLTRVYHDEKNPITIRKNFRQSFQRFGSQDIEYQPNYNTHFEKNYAQYLGRYEMLGSGKNNNSFEVVSVIGQDMRIVVPECKASKNLKVEKPINFETSFTYNNKQAWINFDPDAVHISDSANPCLPDGKYHFFGENY